MHRRQFMMLTSGASAAAAYGLWKNRSAGQENLPLSEPPSELDGSLHLVRKTSRALGAEVTMTVLHEQADLASEAIDAAFHELELVEQLMSIYRPASELSQLNRDKRLNSPHPYIVQVLRYAEETSRLSGGAFDITVQPLWELFSKARRSGRLPSAEEIARARQYVDWRQLRVDVHRVTLDGNHSAGLRADTARVLRLSLPAGYGDRFV